MFITLKNQLNQLFTAAFSLVLVCFLFLLLSGSVSPVFAQEIGDNEGEGGDNDVSPVSSADYGDRGTDHSFDEQSYGVFGHGGGRFAGRFLSDDDTHLIIKELGEASTFCSRLDEVYRIDCLSNQYEQIADTLPERGDYEPIKTQLMSAAQELAALARENQDPIVPVLPVTSPEPKSKTPKAKTTRPLVPVSKKRIAKVQRAAVKVIEETQTILLRSAENSRRRQTHYTKIATAIGSNKVLLRSA